MSELPLAVNHLQMEVTYSNTLGNQIPVIK